MRLLLGGRRSGGFLKCATQTMKKKRHTFHPTVLEKINYSIYGTNSTCCLSSSSPRCFFIPSFFLAFQSQYRSQKDTQRQSFKFLIFFSHRGFGSSWCRCVWKLFVPRLRDTMIGDASCAPKTRALPNQKRKKNDSFKGLLGRNTRFELNADCLNFFFFKVRVCVRVLGVAVSQCRGRGRGGQLVHISMVRDDVRQLHLSSLVA